MCYHENPGKHKRIGLGLLAPGILPPNKLISPKLLEQRLKKAQRNGVEEVVLYRLGGIEKYLKIIKKFT